MRTLAVLVFHEVHRNLVHQVGTGCTLANLDVVSTLPHGVLPPCSLPDWVFVNSVELNLLAPNSDEFTSFGIHQEPAHLAVRFCEPCHHRFLVGDVDVIDVFELVNREQSASHALAGRHGSCCSHVAVAVLGCALHYTSCAAIALHCRHGFISLSSLR